MSGVGSRASATRVAAVIWTKSEREREGNERDREILRLGSGVSWGRERGEQTREGKKCTSV